MKTILKKMTVKHITFFFWAFFLIGCKNNTERNITSEYQKKSNELITQITSEIKDCSCIIEPEKSKTLLQTLSEENPSQDYKKIMKDVLNIEDDSIFDKLNKLTDNYKIDMSLNNQKHQLIKRIELESILKKYKGREKLNFMIKKCPKGWLSFSPPIFNENFDKAVIPVTNFPGGGLIVYKYENGKWNRIKLLIDWIG